MAKLNYSVSLDGSSKAFSATDHADLKPTGAFTVGGWIKTTTIGTIIFQSLSINSNYAGFYVYIESGGYIRFLSGRNTGTTVNTDYKTLLGNISITDGAWHYITCTSDNTNLKIYVDGVLDNSVAWAYGPTYAATNYVRIGCYNTSGSNSLFFAGNLKNVFLYNGVALVQADIVKSMFMDISGDPLGTDALVAYYKFENNGNDSHTTGTTHDLTNIGSPSYVSTPEDVPFTYYLTSSDNLMSMKFDGSNDSLSITNHVDLRPTGNFTLGSWIKTSSTNTMAIFRSGQASGNYSGIDLMCDSGKVKFDSYRNTGTTDNTDFKQLTGNITVSDGNWHFVVGTWDGSYLRIYVDGVLDNSVAWSYAPGYQSTNIVNIASNQGAQWFWSGKLKNVFLINGTAWDATTIKSKMFVRMTSSETNLKLLLGFDNYLADDSGNSHSASLIDAPYYVPDVPFDLQGARQSVYFNGSSTAASVADHADLKPTGSFTIGAWIKTSTVSRYFFSSSNYTSADGKYSGIQLALDANGKAYLFSGRHTGTTQGTDWQNIITSTTITDSNWHFVVGTWDGSYLRIYVDGASDATAVAWSYAPGYYSTNFIMIGANWNTSASSISNPLLGKQRGTFLINGTAWDATKIASYTTKNIDPTETNLKLLMNLDNNYVDRSGNGHNGTPISTPTFSPIVPYDGVTYSSIKTINGLAYASIKTINGLSISSTKTFNGLQ